MLLRWLLLGLVVGAAGWAAEPAGPPLQVMTYNLRFASENPPHAWTARRPLIREIIQAADPDLVGTQEGLYLQLNDIAADLPGYAWIGLGREGGSRGEFMAVFYRTARLQPLEYDHFWLSDTPDVIGSATWGNQYRRMVTWVRFRDRETGSEFAFWNTHFDHEVPLAREKSATLLRERIAALPAGLPVVLAGDFNAPAGAGAVYATLTGDGFFADAWTAAARRRGEGRGTFNAFGDDPAGGARIDWILLRGPIDVEQAGIVTDTPDGQYPSDHYPVVARIRLRGAHPR